MSVSTSSVDGTVVCGGFVAVAGNATVGGGFVSAEIVTIGVGGTVVGATVDDCCIGIVADGIGTGIEIAVHAAAKTTKKTRVKTCR